jgi:hypothetical protein
VRKACALPEVHNCNIRDIDTPKQAYSAFGEALFAETFGFVLLRKDDSMEHCMIVRRLDPCHKIGGKHSKHFSGTIDTGGVALSFVTKVWRVHPRRTPIVEAGKCAESCIPT